jgi:cytoskeletal protein RodZ
MNSDQEVKIKVIKNSGAGRRPNIAEEVLAKDFNQEINREREQSIGAGKKEGASKDDKKMKLMWLVVAAIMVAVVALWLFNFNKISPTAGGESKKNDTADVWAEVKKSMDSFTKNFNTLFSQLNQAPAGNANQNTQVDSEEMKKITNQVLEKIKQGQAATNTNTNNTNTNIK